MTSIRIALGPLLYYWPRDRVLTFYAAAADWPVDVVYLGETVCSRRHELRLDDWLAIAEQLADAGKSAVLSTYELIESDADLRTMRAVADNGKFLVEANDMGAVHVLANRTPFVAGPFLNIYNGQTLQFMWELGAVRWVAPVELSGAGLREVLASGPADIETEAFAYGRLPLAVSARCFTARYHNLTKDHCAYRCLENPEGIPLMTQDDEPFLVLNGLQTQSGRVHSLLQVVGEAAAQGVNVLRISPQSAGTGEIAGLFAGVARGTLDAASAQAALAPLLPGPSCDGYWHGQPGQARASLDAAR